MIARLRWLRRDASGQSLFEMAVCAPFFVLLVGGMVDVGRFAYVNIEVANSARAAVEYGSQNSTTASDTTGMTTAADNEASNLTLTVTPTTYYCVCSTTGSNCTKLVVGTAATYSCAVGNPLYYVKVASSATFTPWIHYPGLPPGTTITRTVTMQVMQ